jgi:hypothetical protein
MAMVLFFLVCLFICGLFVAEKEFNEHRNSESCVINKVEVPVIGVFNIPISKTTFGNACETGLEGLLIVLYRTSDGGWRSASGSLSHLKLPDQIYVELLEPIISDPKTKEIVAVDLYSGTWKTIWAATNSNISYS